MLHGQLNKNDKHHIAGPGHIATSWDKAGKAGLARTFESGRRSRKRLVLCSQQLVALDTRRRSAHGIQNEMEAAGVASHGFAGCIGMYGISLSFQHYNGWHCLACPAVEAKLKSHCWTSQAVAHSPGSAQDLLRWTCW